MTETERRQAYAFDVDGMLGGLEKWLRILGFDAAFPVMSPRIGRIFVTKRKSVEDINAVTITAQRPFDQLKEVLDQTGIQPDSELLLTRCVTCNLPVEEIPKETVKNEVPEYVFQTTTRFTRCPQCNKAYWEGSHRSRIITRLKNAGIPPR